MFLNVPAARLRRAGWSRGRGSRGFSLIEVLVTLMVIALALLGTVGLQAYSMRVNQGSQFRTQAVFLVADLIERIEANKTVAVKAAGGRAGAYVVAKTSAADFSAPHACAADSGQCAAVAQTCVEGSCSPDAVAAFDLAQWQSAVANPAVLPRSEWEVSYVATPGSATSGVYTIVVSWVDRRTDTTYATAPGAAASQAVGTAAGGTGERFFYTATRAIHSN